eukprot:GHRR01023532.1.p1 GENE.GHRR01023532.1~~GHRR01023532.1.p1  ORF type:complete len:104 (-),score=9.48 GHRR01023532.1:65-376(-)
MLGSSTMGPAHANSARLVLLLLTMHNIPLLKQQLSEVTSILPTNACDQRHLPPVCRHDAHVLVLLFAVSRGKVGTLANSEATQESTALFRGHPSEHSTSVEVG